MKPPNSDLSLFYHSFQISATSLTCEIEKDYACSDIALGGNYMDTLTAVVNRLNFLIGTQETNVNALSNQAGVPQATVKSILNGESLNPGIVTLKKIIDGFENPKVSLADFFGTEEFFDLEQEIK